MLPLTGWCVFSSRLRIADAVLRMDRSTFKSRLDEKVLPDVRLTRSRNGSTGTATFRFKNPTVLDKSTVKQGEITGMYLIDKEGMLETRDVNARFVNGKPQAIESVARVIVAIMARTFKSEGNGCLLKR